MNSECCLRPRQIRITQRYIQRSHLSSSEYHAICHTTILVFPFSHWVIYLVAVPDLTCGRPGALTLSKNSGGTKNASSKTDELFVVVTDYLDMKRWTFSIFSMTGGGDPFWWGGGLGPRPLGPPPTLPGGYSKLISSSGMLMNGV
jgi:hypothetical protein